MVARRAACCNPPKRSKMHLSERLRVRVDESRSLSPYSARYVSAQSPKATPVRQVPRKTPSPALAATLKALDATAPYSVSSSGRYLVATQGKSGLVLFDTKTHRALRQLHKGARGYTLVEISSDARWIAGVQAANPDLIDLWRADNGQLVRTIQAEGGRKQSISFSAEGEQLRVLAEDGRGVIYNIPAGVRVGGFQSGNGGSGMKPPTVQLEPLNVPRTATPQQSAATPKTQRLESWSAAPETASPALPPKAHVAMPKTVTSAPITVPLSSAPGGSGLPTAEPMMAAPAAAEPMAASPSAAEPPTASPFEVAAPAAEPMAATPMPEAAPQARETTSPRAAMRVEAPSESIAPGAEETAVAETEPREAVPANESEPIAASAPSGNANLDAEAVSQLPTPQPEDLSKVTVHYATNRNRLGVADRTWLAYFKGFFFSLPAVIVYVLTVLCLLVFPWFGKRSWAAAALLTGVVVLCSMAALEAYVRSQLRDELSGELYGSIPGDLNYGTCEISVPKPENRSPGELNRPVSVWIFEAPEDPDKHFTLRQVTELGGKDAFYESLSAQLRA